MKASQSDERKPVKGPLSGYRIIEWGTNFTAPLAAMWLADQGADVIKMESRTGDQMRYASGTRQGVTGMAATFANANRNKRSISMDIKQPGAVEAFRSLAEGADVILHNFRPGVMERLGLGYDRLKQIKENIILVSVSGFGETGPYSKQRAYDPIIQGAASVMNVQRDPETNIPRIVGNAVADKVTSLVIFQAITAALLARERTGDGQHVRVNMLNSVISFLWPDAMVNHTWLGDNVRQGGTMTYARVIFKTKDYYLVAANASDAEWSALCTAVDKPQLIDDPRFKTIGDRVGNFGAVYEELENSFINKTTDEWLNILREHDCVCGPLNTEDNLHEDPQVVAAGILVESEHPYAGRYRQPIHAAYFEKTPASLRLPPPMLGEQTEEILREAGLSDDQINELRWHGAIKFEAGEKEGEKNDHR